MISYTYLRGECPISYIAKILDDPSYNAGDDILHYPEMYSIFTPSQTKIYFSITTIIYIWCLAVAAYRGKILTITFILFLQCSIYYLNIHDEVITATTKSILIMIAIILYANMMGFIDKIE